MATIIMTIMVMSLLIWKSNVILRIRGYALIGEFEHVSGLLERAAIRYRGYEVGRVYKIVPGPKYIKVYFRVKSRIKVPKGSTLKVLFDGLVGEKYLDIRPTLSKKMLKPNSHLKGYSSLGIANFVDVGTQNLQELKAILKTFNETLASNEMAESVKRTILAVEQITKNINKIVVDSDKINNIVVNLDELTTKLNKAVDSDMAVKTARIIDNLDSFSTDLKELLEDEKVKDELVGTLAESRRLFKGSGDIVSTLSSITIKPDMELYYVTKQKKYHYNTSFDFWIDEYFIRFGLGNKLGNDKLLNIQQSLPLYKNFRGRFGIFNTTPGIGVDYELGRVLLSSELYNFGDTELDVIVRYKLLEIMDLDVKALNLLNTTGSDYAVSIHLHMPN